MTRSAVSSLTRPRVSAFSARETVPGCTCAARATSRSVTDDDRTAPLCRRLQADGRRGRGRPAARHPLPRAPEPTTVAALAAHDGHVVERFLVHRQAVAVLPAVTHL